MTDEEKYLEYLSARQDVSIPELQQGFSCSYAEAKRMMDRFRENFWVSRNAEGLRSAVNVSYLTKTDFPLPELARISREVCPEEMELIDRISLHNDRKEALKVEDAGSAPAAKLLSEGVIHRFDGMYFLSLSPHSLRRLDRLYYGFSRDLAVEALGIPLVLEAIDAGGDLTEILDLPIVPENLRNYVETQMAVYQIAKVRPRRRFRDMRGKEALLRNLMIRALFSSREYGGKDGYVTEARRCADAVCKSPLTSARFRDAARAVAEYVENDLSEAALRAVKTALKISENEEDDDDDDDCEVF